MSAPRRAWGVAALLCLHGVARAAEPHLAGLPVATALERLAGPGLHFVFSTQLLPPGIVVQREPASADALSMARTLLAPLGLQLVNISPGVYVVASLASLAPRPAETRSGDEGVPERGSANAPQTVADRDAALSLPLTELVVSADRAPFGVKAVDDALLLSGARLAHQTGPGEDPLRSLAQMAGMSQVGSFGRFNIRGGRLDEVAIQLDGFPLRNAFHLPGSNGLLSIVDPGVVSDIALYTGALPARLGDAMSGVIDMHGIDVKSGAQHSLGLGYLSSRLLSGGPLDSDGRSDMLIAARAGTTGYLSTALAPASGRPRYSDLYARFTQRTEGGTQISVNALLAGDQVQVHRDGLDEESSQDNRLRYYWVHTRTPLADDTAALSFWVGRSEMAATRDGRLQRPGFAIGVLNEQRSSDIEDLRAAFELRASERHALEFGIEASHEQALYTYDSAVRFDAALRRCLNLPASRVEDMAAAPARSSQALYVSDTWQLQPRLLAQFGLRMTSARTELAERQVTWDPRVLLTWALVPGTSVRAGWGRVHQLRELPDVFPDESAEQRGRVQSSEYLTLGMDRSLAHRLTLRTEAFVKWQGGLQSQRAQLLRSPSILPELSFDQTWIQPRNAQLKGLETYLQYGGEQLRWSMSYTWSQARDMLANRLVARDWDQRNAVTFSLDWQHGAWLYGAVLSGRSGHPTTRIAVRADGTADIGSRNAARLGSVLRADLRAEWHKPLLRGDLSASFQLGNISTRRSGSASELQLQPDAAGNPALTLRQGRAAPMIPWAGIAWDF